MTAQHLKPNKNDIRQPWSTSRGRLQEQDRVWSLSNRPWLCSKIFDSRKLSEKKSITLSSPALDGGMSTVQRDVLMSARLDIWRMKFPCQREYFHNTIRAVRAKNTKLTEWILSLNKEPVRIRIKSIPRKSIDTEPGQERGTSITKSVKEHTSRMCTACRCP